jgi:hypothetical protein
MNFIVTPNFAAEPADTKYLLIGSTRKSDVKT